MNSIVYRSIRGATLQALVLLALATVVHAQQVQVKPWFLVIVDTSGSMQQFCTNGATTAPACTNCTGGCTSNANSCGLAHTRINDAKCALRNILNSTGDAEFGLMQFTHLCNANCVSRTGGDSSTCDADMLVGIASSNYSLLTWVDGSCATTTCASSTTSSTSSQELYAYGNTPLYKSLQRAQEYFAGSNTNFQAPTKTDAYIGCRPMAVILLTDGGESCGGTPTTAATALRMTTVPGPASTTKTVDIKTYVIGFGGLSNSEANATENIAIAGGTDAPGPKRAFYASDEETLSAALNQIITDSQLTERCDGKDNDCDNRIDEDSPKYCDVHGIRTSNPQVPSGSGANVDQSMADSRVPACSGGTCPAVAGVQGNNACAAPEWSQSSTCNPANILCSSPGELCDGQDDDCDGRIDESAPAIDPSKEVCGDRLDNDCDGNVDENCNGCISQAEICNNKDDDCDTRIDETLSRGCGSSVGECTAGTETCNAGAWVGCTAVGGMTESCDGKDNDCDGVIDGITRPCGPAAVGLCRPGTETCSSGAWGTCTGKVDPAAELCDNQDNDCDNDPNDDGADDSRVKKACGSSVGVCKPGMTVCDHGEIRCTGAVSASAELCDGLDNDCDGKVDEAVSGNDTRIGQPCVVQNGTVTYGPVTTQGQCVTGRVVCAMGGQLSCAGYVGPSAELCDALDQDCDGNPVNGVEMTDPRVGARCGTGVGECRPGQIVCVNNGLTCNAVPPGTETCNGKDDDCDGLTDENLPASPQSCDTSTPAHGNRGACHVGQEACLGGKIVCAGEVTPSPEVCNNIDDDCDGAVDNGNPGGGRPCGSSIGSCIPSTSMCNQGQLSCPGATLPSDEKCDGLDNDCDGVTDEDNPEGGAACDRDGQGNVLVTACRTSADPTNSSLAKDQPCGECRFGQMVCKEGALSCIGTLGPKLEVCDGLDNDCDSPCVIDNKDPAHPVKKCPSDPCQLAKTDLKYLDCDAKIDEGVSATDPNVGVPCIGGSGECKQGIEQCQSGVLTCVGGQSAIKEVCNGKDDDCDTLIDEGFGVGSACGIGVGECEQGTVTCDDQGGLRCDNEKLPTDERCDGLDNDCDGVIDDGNPEGGGTCGSSVGECRTGVEKCIAGKLLCTGGQAAAPEVCDCKDNDCDGTVDEDPTAGTAICAGAAICTMCQCAQPCRQVVEFSDPCPAGKSAVTIGGDCRCVGERCNDTSCNAQTLTAGNDVRCQPDSKTVGPCVCRNNECSAQCDAISCPSGLVCDPTSGACKERSCLLPQFACKTGEYCDITTLGCAVDPCADVTCDASQACRAGQCFASCSGVTCLDGQSCHDGECSADLCSGVVCPGQVCDPSSGKCVTAGICAVTGCRDGYVCDLVSGECAPDPCLTTTCPAGQVCKDGECSARCSDPLVNCGEVCVNPKSSREHCGATGDCMGDAAGTSCSGSQVCSEGTCTDTCATGLINCDGGCVNPDTDVLHCGARGTCTGLEAGTACSSNMVCKLGSCVLRSSGSSNNNNGNGTDKPPVKNNDPAYRVATTGGGGCTCSVPGAPGGPLPRVPALLVLFGLVCTRRRWRRSAALSSIASALVRYGLVAAALFWTNACTTVNTLCLSNCETDAGATDSGNPDVITRPDSGGGSTTDSGSSQTRPDSGGRGDGTGDGGKDAGGSSTQPDAQTDSGNGSGRVDAAPGCEDTEACNGVDDDCDGKIDEDIDPAALGIDLQTDVNNCGSCGRLCRLDHAFSACTAGECQVESCDAEFTDYDKNPVDGCEYRCTKSADNDATCDHKDDDCDLRIDEDIDFAGDAQNCGSCGNGCEAPNTNTGAAYCDQGICKLDSTKCKAGFVDVDGNSVNGCEYQCTLKNASLEQCNNSDDDCDHKIDEAVGDTDTRIGKTCGSAVGTCVAGTTICTSGQVVCQGGNGPTTELCNGKDDDCDGNVDEAFPQRGLPCGMDLGVCTRGVTQCAAGALVCMGGMKASAEICDNLDNDCDGRTDETDSVTKTPPQGVGRTCRTLTGGTIQFDPAPVVGECHLGVAACTSGHLLCAGEVGPKPELCDALDQDCDGNAVNNVAMTDPSIGAPCGNDVGECKFGFYVCNGTTRSCDNSNGKTPVPEMCNGKDDDCDGNFDETDSVTKAPPDGAGKPCRVDTAGQVSASDNETVKGECKLGTSVCSGGVVACPDFHYPQPELCDTLDQDCDGDPLDGVSSTDSRIGQTCTGGSSMGACRPGTQYCASGGMIACQGTIGPSAELCDGIDNNCNGSLTDDGSDEPTRGMTCGMTLGSCKSGTLQCAGGTMSCVGQVTAVTETCDSQDNDCDGKVDEDFQLQTNVNRCGACNNACSFPNATAKCVSGTCQIANCASGYYDSKTVAGADCSVGPCSVAGNEICNGNDDDCDGEVDEDLTAPSGVCNTIGACAGAKAVCQGSSGWVCDKLPGTERCNGLDDNCNGQTDEGFPIGQSCAANGVGACATSGTLGCSADGSGTTCLDSQKQPVQTGTPGNETCNGSDDDCDGKSDEACPSSDNNCVTDAWVGLGAGTEIYKYEAARPDSTDQTAGSRTTRACSALNRLPWTNITYLDARDACKAADPNGRLCTEAEWVQACMAGASTSSDSCTWAFPNSPACNTFVNDQCNGVDFRSTPATQTTGKSGAREACYRGSSSTASGQIFELSGNVKEYALRRGTGGIPVRGGASNNTKDGLRCDFDFPVWPNNSPFVNVGFRCCRNATPLPPQCGTFQNTGLTVSDPTLATNSLSVPLLDGNITDVNVVNFQGTHYKPSEIDYIELVGPTGLSVRLTNASYCASTSGTTVGSTVTPASWSFVFDSEAATSLPPSSTMSQCGGGTSYKPAQTLTVFNTTNPLGTWTIRVHDSNSAANPVVIKSWGVRVCTNPN